jgi:cell division protein ZapA
MNTMSSNQIRVNIFGAEYVLRANEDNQEQVIEIAKYVDQKMREIDRSQAINSNLKIAILSALNIAEELFQNQKYQERLYEEVNQDSKILNRSLRDAIDL